MEAEPHGNSMIFDSFFLQCAFRFWNLDANLRETYIEYLHLHESRIQFRQFLKWTMIEKLLLKFQLDKFLQCFNQSCKVWIYSNFLAWLAWVMRIERVYAFANVTSGIFPCLCKLHIIQMIFYICNTLCPTPNAYIQITRKPKPMRELNKICLRLQFGVATEKTYQQYNQNTSHHTT